MSFAKRNTGRDRLLIRSGPDHRYSGYFAVRVRLMHLIRVSVYVMSSEAQRRPNRSGILFGRATYEGMPWPLSST